MATSELLGAPATSGPSKNIENNPMQSREPLENNGGGGMDILPAKNILTRRANHRHIAIIAPIVEPTVALPVGSSRDRRLKI
jgi:hypothetical protein